MSRWSHFQSDEFRRCIPPCSIDEMNPDFLDLLEKARSNAGVPFVLNCAFRSKDYDLRKGRSGNSYHTLGRAVDIRCIGDSHLRHRIVECCTALGLTVGIHSKFIHVDNRLNPILFLY